MKTSPKNNSPSTSITQEHLEITFTDYDSFIPWKNSFAGNKFFEWLKTKFEEFDFEHIQNDQNIFFHKDDATFAFRMNTEILNTSAKNLWNYWKDQIIDHGYLINHSVKDFGEKENTLRYHLKPDLKKRIENEQLFGNITLELIQNHALPIFITLKCNWYEGYNYKKALSYGSLMDVLTH